MTRPSWDDIWLELAVLMSARSLCRVKVGAAVVDTEQRVIQTGYAGPPAGYEPQRNASQAALDEAGCLLYCARAAKDSSSRDPAYGDCPSVHAEINTIAKADGPRMKNGSFYVSSVPCFSCAKAVANTGVKRVLWYRMADDAYRRPQLTRKILSQCGIEWLEISHDDG